LVVVHGLALFTHPSWSKVFRRPFD